jgi:tetratricopeptide (TPR) repeat protein
VSGLRQAGAIETADRFAHVPSLVLVAMLASTLAVRSIHRSAAVIGFCGLVALVAGQSRDASAHWRDSGTLWKPVVERFSDQSPVPHQNYGKWMLHEAFVARDAELAQRAGQELQRALALDPKDRAALNNLGLLRAWEGDRREAERLFRASIEQDSTFLLPRANLAVLLAGMGRYDEARAAWKDALDTGGFMPPAIDASLRRTLGPPPWKGL